MNIFVANFEGLFIMAEVKNIEALQRKIEVFPEIEASFWDSLKKYKPSYSSKT